MFHEAALAVFFLFLVSKDPSVAMVVSMEAAVTMTARDGSKKSLRCAQMLVEGDRLTIPARGKLMLLIHKDKHREVIEASSEVTVTLSPDGCMPATAVRRLEPVYGPSEVEYQKVGRLAGSGKAAGTTFRDKKLPAEPPAVTPLFGSVVLTPKPTLSWKSVPEVTGYEVRLYRGRLDSLAPRDVPLWTARTSQTTLPYPPQQAPLELGSPYCWLVVVEGGAMAGKTIWRSQFTLWNKYQVEELEAAKRLAASSDSADLLLAALTYQEHHAYDEALKLFQRLAALRPEEPFFQAALADYYARAGRPQDADKALLRAKELKYEAPEK
jgi:hypothetical protein